MQLILVQLNRNVFNSIARRLRCNPNLPHVPLIFVVQPPPPTIHPKWLNRKVVAAIAGFACANIVGPTVLSGRAPMPQLWFVEQDRSLVHYLTMPLIPKEKRWSSRIKEQEGSPHFVDDAHAARASKKGMYRTRIDVDGSYL